MHKDKCKTDHHAIGNEWQYVTVNVEVKKCKMKMLGGDHVQQCNKITENLQRIHKMLLCKVKQ